MYVRKNSSINVIYNCNLSCGWSYFIKEALHILFILISLFSSSFKSSVVVWDKVLECDWLLSLAGVPEPAGRVSSGSLRAHAELLEQRLQAAPLLRLHPLLPHRGRHEHGVAPPPLPPSTQRRHTSSSWWRMEENLVEALQGERVARFLYLLF